jgi:hypothetical protein
MTSYSLVEFRYRIAGYDHLNLIACKSLKAYTELFPYEIVNVKEAVFNNSNDGVTV